MKKELSGLFLSEERFAASLEELRTSETCTHVRLFHNTGQQVKWLVDALSSGAAAVVQVEIGDLDLQGAEALEYFLKDPATTCRPRHLHIQHVADTAAARALGQGLAAPTCSVKELGLFGMTQSQLAAVLEPIASSQDTAARIHTLQLLQCHVSSSSAAAIGAMNQLIHLEATMDDAAVTSALAPYSSTDCMASCSPPQLQTLKLSRSHFSPAGIAVVAATIRNTHLTHVTLSEVAIGEQAASMLADAVAHSSTVEHLDLSSCQLGPAAGGPLGAAAANGSLKTLLLDDNELRAQGVAALVQSLAASAPGSLQLERLQLGQNRVRGADLPPDLADLKISAPLTWLSLERNQLLDAGAAALLPMFGAAGTLEHLDLRENGVGQVGAAHVVAVLKASPRLRGLILEGNRLHDPGAESVMAAALAHPALRTLRMDACRVASPVVKAKIAEACMTLAARGRVSTDSSSSRASLDLTAQRQRRIGTRFPPEVYQVQHGPVVQQPMDVAQAPAAGRVRMGSRFPPEVYMRPVAEEEVAGDGAPQQGPQQMEATQATQKHVRDVAGDGEGAAMMHLRRRVSCEVGASHTTVMPTAVNMARSASGVDGTAHVMAPWGATIPQCVPRPVPGAGALSISPQSSLGLSPQSSLAESPSTIGQWVRRRFKPLTPDQQRQFADF